VPLPPSLDAINALNRRSIQSSVLVELESYVREHPEREAAVRKVWPAVAEGGRAKARRASNCGIL